MDAEIRAAAEGFTTAVNMTLREINVMEQRAAVTRDAGLMKRANEGLLRLCAVVDETANALDALERSKGERGEG